MRPKRKLKLFAVRLYSRIWLPAAVFLTCLAVYNFIVTLKKFSYLRGVSIVFSLFFEIITRGTQILEFWFGGVHFAAHHYHWLSFCFYTNMMTTDLAVIIQWMIGSWHEPEFTSLLVYVVFHALINMTELCLYDDFRPHKQTEMVLECMDYLISADSISLNNEFSEAGRTSTWSNVFFQLRRRSTGPIALLDDRTELGSICDSSPVSSLWQAAPEFTDSVLHWSTEGSDLYPKKALWITVDVNEGLKGIPRAVFEIIFACSKGIDPTAVSFADVSSTHSVFWPFVRGLAAAYPEYSEQLVWDIPTEMADHFRGSEMIRRLVFRPQHNVSLSPWLYYNDCSELVKKLIVNVLDAAHYEHLERVQRGFERFKPPPRILLIIHGLRSHEQADEVYKTITALCDGRKQHCDHIRIVVISSLQFWRHVSHKNPPIMEYACSLAVSDDGFVRYSGTNPDPPAFDEHLFLLLVEGIHRTGGVEADR
ncbi:hypothetical protein MSAN_00468100 [Mycena sanguinolenta]|uniref:Uncharacterized protein n=1 Tax=Mycena sanguinolenta TaxID=230812 RepID=A0A8H6ZED5_9AGAR|nr:hypothetical protein MSAN_00468100 [Mycena sanguinolenta]